MDHMSIITQVSNPKEEEIISFNQEKASQSKSSLKKQRSRSIFSTLFCCFRNYNVEPPATNTNTSSLPPPVEENGSPPKCDQVEVIPVPSPPAKYLLPEMKISDYGRKCVVIDLDETLVHSSFKKLRLLHCHDEPGPIRRQLLPHSATAIGLLLQGWCLGFPRLAVSSVCLRLLCEPVHQHPLPHPTEHPPLDGCGPAAPSPLLGHAHSDLTGVCGAVAVCGRVLCPLPVPGGDDQGRVASLLRAFQPLLLGTRPDLKLRGPGPGLPRPLRHSHLLLRPDHPAADGPRRPPRRLGRQSSPSQQAALSAPGYHGDRHLPALLPALSRDPVSAPARCLRWVGLCGDAGAAAGSGGDVVSGGVQQHGEPPPVLLLNQVIQGQHEGRTLVPAVQQGVIQVRTLNVEKGEHHLILWYYSQQMLPSPKGDMNWENTWIQELLRGK